MDHNLAETLDSSVRNLLLVAHEPFAKVHKVKPNEVKITSETYFTAVGVKTQHTVTVKGQIVLSSPMLFQAL